LGASKKAMETLYYGFKYFCKPLMAKKCVLCPIQSTGIKIFVEEEGVEANRYR